MTETERAELLNEASRKASEGRQLSASAGTAEDLSDDRTDDREHETTKCGEGE